MKKFLLSVFAIFAFASVTNANGSEKVVSFGDLSLQPKSYHEGVPIINVSDINADMLDAFMLGDIGNVIIEMSEGALLPFRVNLSGNLVNIVPEEREPVYLQIMQTYYIRFDSSDIMFSTDLHNWQQSFDFATGDVSVTLEPISGGTMLKLDAVVNKAE
ncbi:MAG: hypothetical protein VX777_05695 [Chlamydiota bacterium]|nr:hypothetical protein [Chlamydiota bacterium]